MKRVSELLLVCMCAASSVAYAEFKLDMSLEAKPSYRGIRQATDNHPVAQGLIEYVADNGLYAGVWASRLDTEFDERDLQVDYFAGYQRRVGEPLTLDVTLQRYTYHGGEFGNDYDWTELQVAAHLGNHFTVMAAAGENWIGSGERSYLLEASYQYALSERLTVFATIGQHFAEDVLRNDFAYRELGINTVVAGFGIQVSWADSAGAGDAPFLTHDTFSLAISRRIRF